MAVHTIIGELAGVDFLPEPRIRVKTENEIISLHASAEQAASVAALHDQKLAITEEQDRTLVSVRPVGELPEDIVERQIFKRWERVFEELAK